MDNKKGSNCCLRAETVNKVYNDICEGATYSNIMQKLMNDGYGVNFKYTKLSAEKVILAARRIIRQDFEEDRKELKARLYVAIQDVFNECREWGDRGNALKALEQIARLVGLNEPDKIDMKVQQVDINFGLNNETEL